MEESKSCAAGDCKCPCHKMPGIFLVLIGVTFLLGNFNILSPTVVGTIWPILVILLGLKKCCKGMCKCCPEAAK